MEESYAVALTNAADNAVAAYKQSRDLFLTNNKAYLRDFQELRHRVVKNFPDSKELIMSWRLGDAEHDAYVEEIKAAVEARAR